MSTKSIAILITLFVVFTGTLMFAEQQKEKSKIITDFKPVDEEEKKELTAEEKLKIEWEKAKKVETEAEKDKKVRFTPEEFDKKYLTAEERAKIEARREAKRKIEAERQQRLSKFKKSLTEVGRFQATKLDPNAIFILDTKEGHLWVWIIQLDEDGRKGEFLVYQGQVLPGSYMSEPISKTTSD